MKALPGLLVEYLVTGTVFILSILILENLCLNDKHLITFFKGLPDFGSGIVIALPVIYCLGMIIDILAKYLTEMISDCLGSFGILIYRKSKNKIREIKGRQRKEYPLYYLDELFIFIFNCIIKTKKVLIIIETLKKFIDSWDNV